MLNHFQPKGYKVFIFRRIAGTKKTSETKEIESSDSDISADEYEEEKDDNEELFVEDNSSALLDIVAAGIDDLPSGSDWEEDNEEKRNEIENEERKAEVTRSEVSLRPDVSGLGKYLIFKNLRKIVFRFLKNMHGIFGGISK